MNVTDPVADMLTRIRNALQANHQVVDVPTSKLKLEVARILKQEGYIRNFKVVERQPRSILKLLLKYRDDGRPVISGLKRVSKPGCRVYANHASIPKVFGGLGVNILSTSHGVMTGHAARAAGIGGEVMCNVW